MHTIATVHTHNIVKEGLNGTEGQIFNELEWQQLSLDNYVIDYEENFYVMRVGAVSHNDYMKWDKNSQTFYRNPNQ